jgi:hypothetical protein
MQAGTRIRRLKHKQESKQEDDVYPYEKKTTDRDMLEKKTNQPSEEAIYLYCPPAT